MNIYLLQTGGAGAIQPIFFGLIILVFWLFFIRPQAKKQKQQKQFIDNLQPGDKVVTIAGIHGKVSKINDDGTINLEIGTANYVKLERSAISMEWTTQANKSALTPEKK
jgi:preprotein translocase subunit YajC